MGDITWTPEARQDLDAVAHYIAAASPETALDFVERLSQAVRHLATFPQSGRRPPEYDEHDAVNVREVVFRNYRIVYMQRGESMWILAIVHGSMDFRRVARGRGWNLS